MMPMRRAISPVIATVILIAITIVIGAAVGGWLLGLWGGFGDVEAIRIYPDARLEINNNTSAKLSLTLKNEGTRDARIVRVFVEGVGGCSNYSHTNAKVIGAGKTETLDCEVRAESGKSFVAGASYIVKILTESGGVYQITVAARSN